MTAPEALLLGAAGFIAGIVAALAGGSGLITFPALVATGLSPLMATASNSVALSFSNLSASLADRTSFPAFSRRLALLLLLSAIGAAIGAVLLVHTSERMFGAIVPLLIGAATLLFALGPRLRRWALAHSGSEARALRPGTLWTVAALSIYGGYFGTGLGVMYLALFMITEGGNLRQANALKNLVAGAIGVVVFPMLAMTPLVSWPETTALLLGNVLGGYAGGRIARFIPDLWVRNAVLAFGTAQTALLVWRNWIG